MNTCRIRGCPVSQSRVDIEVCEDAVWRTFLVNSFSNPSGPVSANPRCRASATINAAATYGSG
jgi:hypothetical protein